MKLLVLALVVVACQAREFKRCELVRELRAQGFPEGQMRDWVCLVENESHSRTHQIGRVNKNGSRDYGLFQINDKYWCSKTSTPGKDCNLTCAGVCLVENENYSRTDKVGHNHDGSSDYGLFQINDRYWCSHGAPGRDCHVSCSGLLTDNITKACRCAKKIFQRHHFMAWYGWRKHCKVKPLPDISNC